MRKLLIILLFIPLLSQGVNYYVSNAGDDSHTGTSQATAWRTLAKVNASFTSISFGDSVLFRRGDTFHGSLTIGSSGRNGYPIVFGAYGTGDDPVISGFEQVVEWNNTDPGIYSASMDCSPGVNMVTINGIPQPLGRYPNTGWLTYESFSTYVSITDNELTSSPDWTGAELVVRKNHWIIDRAPITNHSGTTITYTAPSTYNGAAGYGYFIQRSLACLDAIGEWHFDGTNLNMYFGAESPYSYVVKASIYDTLVYCSKSYIAFDNLTLEGANLAGFLLNGCSHIVIQNCSILNSGRDAIFGENTSYLTVNNSTINYALNTAIDLDTQGGSGSNATITYNTVKNCGTLVGMDKGDGDGCNFGLSIQVPKSVIKYNSLDSLGYHGIIFVEDSTLVENNIVNHFCLVKDDGSGIYTYQQTATPVYYGRTVKNNLVLNGEGEETGTSDGLSQANGIYMDGYTQNVTISGNTVYNCNLAGLFLGWYSSNISVLDNLFFASKYQLLIERKATSAANYTIRRNKFVSRNVEDNMIQYTAGTVVCPPWTLGTWDSNYYVHPCGDDAVFVADYTYNSKRYIKGYTFANWQAFDTHAFADITNITGYSALKGTNLFSNGNFTSNVLGASLSYAGTASFAWDNTNKIDNGSLKLTYSSLSTTSNSTNIKLTVGNLDASKDYILNVSTLAASGEHMANVHLRQDASPYAYLTPIQYVRIGSTVNNAEILFRNPTSGSAYIYIVVDDSTGTCYIDKVGLYEAQISDKNLDNYLFFDYSESGKTITPPANFVDLNGAALPASVTMQPYTSVLYVLNPLYTYKYTVTSGKYSADRSTSSVLYS